MGLQFFPRIKKVFQTFVLTTWLSLTDTKDNREVTVQIHRHYR